MPIIKWTPFLEPFGEFDKWPEDWPTHLSSKIGEGDFMPSVDVYETKNEVVVETPLAGVDPEKIEITIRNDVLTLKGKLEEKREIEEKNYYRKEVKTGSFYRSVTLPAHVITEKAKAISTDGLFKITIPRAPESQVKTIKVKISKNKKK